MDVSDEPPVANVPADVRDGRKCCRNVGCVMHSQE